MQKINAFLLQKSLHRLGVADIVEASKIVEIVKSYLERYLGQTLAKEITVCWVKNKTLGLRLHNAPLRDKLKREETDILQEINKSQHKEVINRIRFLL